jgi:excisionase family DNA binding protein
MRLRCTTEAWLYRLAIRENSAASVTHGFGTHDHASCDGRDAQRPGLRCRQHQPASRATVPGAPAIGPARQSAQLTWTFGNSSEDADTRRGKCTMKPWLNVSEAAEYASLSRDTIYTACERGELRSARVSGRRAIRIRPAWIDAWLERHAPDVHDRCIGDTQNGAVS